MSIRNTALLALALQVGAGCMGTEDVTGEEAVGTDVEQSTVAPSSSRLATLYTWYSPSRHDYFTTTSNAWAGTAGATHSPDYQFVRVEGRVWRADGPQPMDTAPLYLWWNAGRRDNVLVSGTSNDGWLSRAGYTRVRLEGYVATQALAGMIGLEFVYSGNDYAVTADPTWDEVGYRSWRRQGYVFKPGYWMAPTPEPEVFGYNRDPVSGTRPLMVIVRNYLPSRATTSQGEAFYRQFVFGPGAKTIPGFFTANSYGRFTFTDAGVFETYTASTSDVGAIRSAGYFGVDFARYDRNRDGRVSSDELALVVVTKDGIGCAQTRPVACVRPARSRVDVCLSSVSFVGEKANFSTIAHEISHQLGMWDLYGPGAAWNQAVTTAAGTCSSSNDTRSFQLDPWHKMHWGWVRPRVVSADEPGTVEPLYTPAAFGSYAYHAKQPVIVFDPDRGTREFFMLEARARDGAYDANVADNGMAAWLVNLGADLAPVDIAFNADADPELEHIFGVRLFNGPDSAGATGLRGGASRLIRPTDGEIALRWADGTTAVNAVSFAWQDTRRKAGFVQIGTDRTFRARLDDVSLVASRGSTLWLRGVFGVAGARGVGLYSGTTRRATLTVAQWLPEGAISVEIPRSVARGAYTIRIDGPRAGVVSNRVGVHVY